MYVNSQVVPTLSKTKREMSLPLASDCKELHETAEKLRRTYSMSLPKFAPSLSSLGTGTHNASLFHEFSLPLFRVSSTKWRKGEKRLRKSLLLLSFTRTRAREEKVARENSQRKSKKKRAQLGARSRCGRGKKFQTTFFPFSDFC